MTAALPRLVPAIVEIASAYTTNHPGADGNKPSNRGAPDWGVPALSLGPAKERDSDQVFEGMVGNMASAWPPIKR